MPEQCPCPCPTPGAVGAGPAPALCDLECQDLDKAWIEKTYQHNVAVIALATEGIQRGVHKNIRDISGEIRTKRTSENIKLARWYAQMGCGTIPVDFGRAQSLVDSLNQSMGNCFDVGYAQTMIAVLDQDVQANEVAMQRATLCQFQDHARISARNAGNEAFRLRRWVDEKGSVYVAADTFVAPATCP